MSVTVIRTGKQRAIMRIILEAADRGEFLGLEDILNRLGGFEPAEREHAYNALRCSLKFLRRQKMLVLEKSGTFSINKPTPLAYAYFRAGD